VVQKKKWTPRFSTRGRRIFIPYEVFYDIEWDEVDRFNFCKVKHTRRKDAERCAKRTVRRIQKGRSAVVLTLVVRPTLSASRTRVERVPVPGLNDDVWRFMKEMYKNRCYYCDRGGIKLQREHRIPLARGGDNHLSNIVPACEPCNRRKGILTDDEYFKLLADEHDYRPSTATDGTSGPPSPPLPVEVGLDGKAVKVPFSRRGARVELPADAASATPKSSESERRGSGQRSSLLPRLATESEGWVTREDVGDGRQPRSARNEHLARNTTMPGEGPQRAREPT